MPVEYVDKTKLLKEANDLLKNPAKKSTKAQTKSQGRALASRKNFKNNVSTLFKANGMQMDTYKFNRFCMLTQSGPSRTGYGGMSRKDAIEILKLEEISKRFRSG